MLLPERSIEKLDQSHQIEAFDCGVPELNYFLVNYALLNQRANSTKTYVGCEDKKVIGYYSLAVGSVIHTRTPERVAKGLAKHPVPVMLLARLAVDKEYQSMGIGKGLLKKRIIENSASRRYCWNPRITGSREGRNSEKLVSIPWF